MKRTTAGGIGILCAALAVGTGLFFQTGGIGHVTDLAGKMTEEYIRQNGENEAVPADASGEEGYLQLLPGIDGCDGFFVAKFTRV